MTKIELDYNFILTMLNFNIRWSLILSFKHQSYCNIPKNSCQEISRELQPQSLTQICRIFKNVNQLFPSWAAGLLKNSSH